MHHGSGFKPGAFERCEDEMGFGIYDACHTSTGTWSELPWMITPSFLASLSQVRPEKLVEKAKIE